MNELRDEIELPSFDWARMAEVAADELCTPEEHPDHEACMACLAIKGTRWTLEMRKQLDSSLAANREQKAEIEQLTAVLSMTVARLGGLTEGRPTARINFLQRVDELVAKESECASLRASVGEKPEDALLRRIVAHSESLEKSGELLIDEEYNSIVRGAKALVAPTLPTEKEK